jgi:GMP synthase (glutamine-hydrolysing)
MHLQEKILIIDFGSQVTQLIARRVRECGVYAEIVSYKISEKALFKFNPKAIILSGGPASVSDNDSPSITKGIFSLNIPILAICYGQQLICSILGGKVEKSNHREFGKAEITICEHSPLFTNFWNKGNNYVVWMSHGDRVIKIPDNFKVIAKTNNAPFAAIADEKKKIYGVQFHPEVTHTPLGIELFRNFIKIAGCTPSWNMGSFLQKKLDEIKQEVGNQKVICGVSGGVDSSVVATLLHKAIGKQLHCVFVNTGLLRKNEANQVKEIFSKLKGC